VRPCWGSLPVRVNKKMEAAGAAFDAPEAGVNLVPAVRSLRTRSRDTAVSTRGRAILAPPALVAAIHHAAKRSPSSQSSAADGASVVLTTGVASGASTARASFTTSESGATDGV